jgi:hypothetical protein
VSALAEISALVAQFVGKAPHEITPEMRLHADLHLTGDDAHGLMALFQDRFKVDMSGFVWLRYFEDEGWNFLDPAVVMVGSLFSRRFAAQWTAAEAAEREITVAHLAEVADRRVWFDPGPEHHRARLTGLGNVLSLVAATPIVFLAALGAIACYGYFSGEVGGVSWLTAAGLIAMTLFPLFFVWNAIGNVRRKLASA